MIARLLPKDVVGRTLVLVTPKPSQLTIRWQVTHANPREATLVNVETGKIHTEPWKDLCGWIRKGQLIYVE